MQIIKKNNLFYLKHSFRKYGKVKTKQKYLGKDVPKNIEQVKEELFRECLQEELFKKLKDIQKNFKKEWKNYPESIKKKILLDLAINFTYNTNAIEGSTISFEETQELVKHKIAPNKPLSEVQETVSHIDTFFAALQSKSLITTRLLCEWNKGLFFQTKSDIAGLLREYHVRVADYIAPDWQDVKKMMKNFTHWIEQNQKIMQPVEFAARAHYKFEKIHPFGDGNGRVGRLIIAKILKQSKYPILTINYKNRQSYYKALQKDENKFVQYFLRRYISQFKRHLNKQTKE
ncbi:Fic family protein [archaeon]|jgi:Fic family protein|nr:Fic family protein [archaeon]MBT6698493.1 Fic family protein [archaeon]